MNEQIVNFGIEESLHGIVTTPDQPSKETAILLLNAGSLHKVGPHRLHVKLARSFAELGYTTLRFDLLGIGDSEDQFVDEPAERSFVGDTISAMDFLQESHGKQKFMLMGICMGALVSIAAAASDKRVRQLVMMEGIYLKTWRYHVTRFMSPKKWLKVFSLQSHFIQQTLPRILLGRKPVDDPSLRETEAFQSRLNSLESELAPHEQVRRLQEDGVRILLLYREGNEIRNNYRLKSDGNRLYVGKKDSTEPLQVRFIRFADHTFTTMESQKLLRVEIMDWLEREAVSIP